MNKLVLNHRVVPRAALLLGLLWVAFAVFVPAVFMPAFGSDGHWLAASSDAIANPITNVNTDTLTYIDWSTPPLFNLLLHTAQRLSGVDAIPVLRGLAVGLHVTISLLLARLTRSHRQSDSASLWVLALALASPAAYRVITALAFLPTHMAVLVLVLAVYFWQRKKGERALMLGVLAFGLIATHTAAAQALFALLALYLATLILALLIGSGIARVLAQQHRIATRISIGLVGMSLMCAGTLMNINWLNIYAQTASATRAMLNVAQTHAPAIQTRLLVLNTPSSISPISSLAWMAGGDEQLLPDDPTEQRALLHWPADTLLTFGQLVEGPASAPKLISGLPVGYGTQLRLNSNDAKAQLRNHNMVILGGNIDGQFKARSVGGYQPAAPTADYLARFESGDNVILLTQMDLCAPDGLALTLQLERGHSPSSKLFRHALRGGEQLAGNDAGLIGGLLELFDMQPGGRVHDISYFEHLPGPPDAMRIGIYDWQTGQRWLALHADGAQWAENAVTLPRPQHIKPCAQS